MIMKHNTKKFGLEVSFIVVMIIALLFLKSEKTYAKDLTVTYGGVVYRVLNERGYTAEVVSVSNNVDVVEIKSSILMVCGNVDYGDFEVNKIAKNAFRNRSKVKSVILPSSINEIEENAFSGINKHATFTVPYGYVYSMKKLIMNKKVGWKNSMKLVQSKKSSKEKTVGSYKYSIKPLSKNVCHYFYVKTNNPDPDSFVIVDDNTKLKNGAAVISKCEDIFADVKYTDKKKYRVNGGYIFEGYNVDGGNLKVMTRTEYYSNGNFETKYTYAGKKINCPKLTSMERYLIEKYTDKSMSFFEKMDAVQKGLNSICLYSGAYVRGELKKSKISPYYGLSTSPHVDQDFYIQNPFYRTDSKGLLVSRLYPYILDSLGFPSEMASVAKTLSPKAEWEWSSYAHYLVDVTYNGKKQTYGGSGSGGGQGIDSNMLKHKYKFDGSKDDFSKNTSWSSIRKQISYYGNKKVEDGIPKKNELTWSKVAKKVGKGSYVRLVVLTSVFGGSSKGYSYLYKDDNTYRGFDYMYDCWYDGRYFNKWEFFEKGAKYSKHPTSDIIIKDFVAKLPDNGRIYYYGGSKERFNKIYNKVTGVWKGYTCFSYNQKTKCWEAEFLDRLTYRNKGSNEYDYDSYKRVMDKSFRNRCIFTKTEVRKMHIDKNTNKNPKDFYIYDMKSKPGTKGRN